MTDVPAVNLELIARELALQPGQVAAVLRLLDDGNTIPFITRYRKEQTGSLDEEAIRSIEDRARARRQVMERAASILRSIESQNALTPELRSEILAAQTVKRLDDLYLPFRPRRRSRAASAREMGLEPLADLIWNADQTPTGPLLKTAAGFTQADGKVQTPEQALKGAADILAERINENSDVRESMRGLIWSSGQLVVSATSKGLDEGQSYADYFGFHEKVLRIPPHRCLALNRGEREGALKVRITWADRRGLEQTVDLLNLRNRPHAGFLRDCVQDALSRLIHPSLEREVRRELKERAERHAASVFANNLKSLLLQPPVNSGRLIAVDPGFRTGCKIAVLDGYGNCLHDDVIFVTGNKDKRLANRRKLQRLAEEYGCNLFAIGNGTACRETEELISELIEQSELDLHYVIVNEAGASIYSTSPLAREEFPERDATVRGTISIGRRLQDPLSELVKIDPQHLGVGMYQHDVPARLLQESLDQVIESCVNFVGVDLNTASAALLTHVSGLNASLARRITQYRDELGGFRTRRDLLEIPGIGEGIFTQAAGFLKISDGDEPLDRTWIHPESYPVARRILDRIGSSPDPTASSKPSQSMAGHQELPDLAEELQIGLGRLTDIIEDLERPGRDPRTDLPGVVFKKGILNLEDLAIGMELRGTVLNVVDFGAFIDIGLKDSGLVHISKMSQQYIRDPGELVSVGEQVRVWVIGIDKQRRRVSLSLIRPSKDSQTTDCSSELPNRVPEVCPTRVPPVDGGTGKRTEEIPPKTPLRSFAELRASWNDRDSANHG